VVGGCGINSRSLGPRWIERVEGVENCRSGGASPAVSMIFVCDVLKRGNRQEHNVEVEIE